MFLGHQSGEQESYGSENHSKEHLSKEQGATKTHFGDQNSQESAS